jgi:hypothetical protein
MNNSKNFFQRTSQQTRNLSNLMSFSFSHIDVLKARRANQDIKNVLMLVNMELGRMDKLNPLYLQRVDEFDRVMIELTRAKWATSVAMQTGDRKTWKQATKLYQRTASLANTLHELVKSGSTDALDYEPVELSDQGTEILFADGAPLVPSINPIVVLKGSDFDMGYQYARQLIDIFGPWVLERHAGKEYTDDEKDVMGKWEDQIRQHAPEFIPFFHGWVEGASSAGLDLSYENVLDLWTGHLPPSTGYIGEKGLPELGHPLCSGLAAWGRATTDGKLVTGSSGDHDIGHAVTVVAYPEEGNNYIFATFGADGGVPAAGPLYFFGHPGMNDKGLAYVHHGGGPKMIEPKKYWGFGLRRAISVLHILRYCDNIDEAREMDMSFPVGDAGMGDPATAGGYYADKTGAFIIESKAQPTIIRESGELGETDFIYATNAPMHPDVIAAPWLQTEPDNWSWSAPGGWRPMSFKEFNLGSLENPHLMGMKWGWFSSFQRNGQVFEALNQRVGQLDIDTMTEIYRISGTIPEGDWKQVARDYTEEKWRPAVGNSSNALVVIMKPEDGIYLHCVGETKRGLAPMSAKNSSPLYDETNTFWEIRLKGSFADMLSHARKLAEEEIQAIVGKLESATLPESVATHMQDLTQTAQKELAAGDLYLSQSDDVGTRARALRAFTRSQVRARQVKELLKSVQTEVHSK